MRAAARSIGLLLALLGLVALIATVQVEARPASRARMEAYASAKSSGALEQIPAAAPAAAAPTPAAVPTPATRPVVATPLAAPKGLPAGAKSSASPTSFEGKFNRAVDKTKKAVGGVVDKIQSGAKNLWNKAAAATKKGIASIKTSTKKIFSKEPATAKAKQTSKKQTTKRAAAKEVNKTRKFDPKHVAKGQAATSQVKKALANPGGNRPKASVAKQLPRVVPASVATQVAAASALSTAWLDPVYDVLKDWSNLSYDSLPTLRAWGCNFCKQPAFARADAPVVNTYKSFFANTGLTVTTAATSSLGKAVVVAFAGTASIGNWMTDARLTRVAASGLHPSISGEVHRGFFNTIMAHRTLLAAVVAKSKACGPSCTVYVTGHSLGGALATLAASYLVNVLPSNVHIKLYTVASPRVGDRTFANWCNSKVTDSWRAVNQRDPVPHVPFASALETEGEAAVDVANPLGLMMEAWALLGHKGINEELDQEFFHVGNEAWWTGKEFKFCRMPESKLCSLSLAIDLLDATEHMIGNYPN